MVQRDTAKPLIDLVVKIVLRLGLQLLYDFLQVAPTLIHIDLCFAWRIGYSTFYSDRGVIWPTIEALDAAFDIGLPLEDLYRLEAISKGFYDHSGGIFDGCFLAIDGHAILTRQPFDHGVKYKKDCRFHKGGFGIIVIAGCDVDCRFISTSCNHSGSTNDIIAWQNMDLNEAVEIDKKLPPKYFFIGDEAFMNTNQFLSPWPGNFCNPFTFLHIYLSAYRPNKMFPFLSF